MNDLRSLQLGFQGYMFAPGNEPVPSAVAGRSPGDQRRRLDIYAEAYRLRLLEVLEGDYPAVRAVLGSSAFRQLAAQYIARHPSTSPSLRWFGRHLPALIADSDFEDRHAIAELARFEWLQAEVFDARDAPTIDANELYGVEMEAWPALRFRLHTSVRQLRLEYATPQLWSAATEGRPFRPRHAPGDWVMWRSNLDVHWRSLDADENWALRQISQDVTFDALCSGLCQWHAAQDAPTAAIGLLQRWLADGLVAGYGV